MTTLGLVRLGPPSPGGQAPRAQRQPPPHPPRGRQERAHGEVPHRGRWAPGRLPRRARPPDNCERGHAQRRARLHRRPARALEAGHGVEPLPQPPGVLQVVRRRRRIRAKPDCRHEAAQAPRRTTASPHRRSALPAAEVVRRSRLRRPTRHGDHPPVHRHRCSRLRGGRIMLPDDLDLDDQVVVVLGKSRRQRAVPFGRKTALALDRYLRLRASHQFAHLPNLWIGTPGCPPAATKAISCARPVGSPVRWSTATPNRPSTAAPVKPIAACRWATGSRCTRPGRW
jgi:hypothetical protein